MKRCLLTTWALCWLLSAGTLWAGDEPAQLDAEDLEKAQSTIQDALAMDSGLHEFFDKAAGYAVFPKVAKGAIGIGGAHGKGLVFGGTEPVGKSSITQVTIGLQLGGQTYSEIIFFETEDDFTVFRTGRFEVAAQVSAVALTAGVSADMAYSNGVAVITFGQGGLMYEASVGGQKLSYKPLESPGDDTIPPGTPGLESGDDREATADSTKQEKSD